MEETTMHRSQRIAEPLARHAGVPLFAPSRVVTSLDECHFYHTMDVPGYGTVAGQWDLRKHVDDYLGGVELRGKRVLEIGTASGFLCFEMEKRGAEVIAYDLSEEQDWDIVPFSRSNKIAIAAHRKTHVRRLNNAWWLAHRALQSSALKVYGSVYDVPAEIGEVDIATFGCVLLHLRDPFLALTSAARLVREKIVITEHVANHWDRFWPPDYCPPAVSGGFRGRLLDMAHRLCGDRGWRSREERLSSLADAPLMLFLPNHRNGRPKDTWWAFRPEVLAEMLGVLGFADVAISFSAGALYEGRPQDLYTVIGRRV